MLSVIEAAKKDVDGLRPRLDSVKNDMGFNLKDGASVISTFLLRKDPEATNHPYADFRADIYNTVSVILQENNLNERSRAAREIAITAILKGPEHVSDEMTQKVGVLFSGNSIAGLSQAEMIFKEVFKKSDTGLLSRVYLELLDINNDRSKGFTHSALVRSRIDMALVEAKRHIDNIFETLLDTSMVNPHERLIRR